MRKIFRYLHAKAPQRTHSNPMKIRSKGFALCHNNNKKKGLSMHREVTWLSPVKSSCRSAEMEESKGTWAGQDLLQQREDWELAGLKILTTGF